MAVPRKKMSIAKKHQRTSTWRTLKIKKLVNGLVMTTCKNCGAKIRKNYVCPVCGYYKGKQVITIKAKKGEDVIEA